MERNGRAPEREAQRVRFNYQTYLGRDASPSEVDLWVKNFLSGVTNEGMVALFVGSQEYYFNSQKGQGNKAAWIKQAYLDVLFRQAAQNEIVGWLQFLG